MFLKNLSSSLGLLKTPQGLLLLLFKKQHMSTKQTTTTTKDSSSSYFAAVHHISHIVRKDFYLERTLNKLNFPLTSDLVYRVLCASHNSPTESFRFFNWTQQQHPNYTPTTLEYEQLIKTLAKNKQFETMFKVLHQMGIRGLPFSSDTASFVIEQYGKHRLVDQAVGFFNGLGKLGCVQTVCVYNSLLFALCESRVFHGAYALVRRMIRKGVKPDKRSYAVLVNAWCSNGKMKEARAFLEEMSAMGFSPPVRGRDLLVEGLLNAGYVDCAKDMVRKMSKEGFVPDVDTFNVLVESVCCSGKSGGGGEGNEGVEFCVELFYNACKLGFCPDISTYKILVPAVSKVGKIDMAFRLLNNSIEDGHKPFPSLYAPIIKGLCKLGRFDDAFSFFSDMKIKGHPPNRPVYTMLITMCGRGGRYVDAANYLMEMTELGLTPISRCFDMVADGLKNCGKHDLARRIEQLEVNLRGV